jgi:hypothetical protein
MESRRQVILKHCQLKATDPMDCLSIVLATLQDRLLRAVVMRDSKTGHPISPQQEIEGQLLQLLEGMLKPDYKAAVTNTNLEERQINPPDVEYCRKRAEARETTLLIIRDLINEAEHQGHIASSVLDAITNEDGTLKLGDPSED